MKHTRTRAVRKNGCPRSAAKLVLLGALLISLRPTLGATSDVAYSPDSKPFGRTYAQWCAAWWQWGNSLRISHHPLYDTGPINVGQSGPVWFFGGHWVNNTVKNRSGTVPDNVALLFVIEGTAADNSGCPNPTTFAEAYLRSLVKTAMDEVHDVTCTIDGVAIPSLLPSYRVQSTAFTFVCPPTDNILVDREGEPCYSNSSPTAPPWTIDGAVGDEVCVIVPPLSPGLHRIHFTGQVGNPVSLVEDMTYTLTSVPVLLTSARQGTNILLSWSTIATNSVLESSSTLGSTNWSAVAGAVRNLSDRYQLAIPAENGSQFFRLRN